jgi:hypothetical protein
MDGEDASASVLGATWRLSRGTDAEDTGLVSVGMRSHASCGGGFSERRDAC